MRCQFCHKDVPMWWYFFHVKGHTRLKADGQQEEHITLPPVLRDQGSLEGVPRIYRHPRCGGMTGMPEEIIRSYLKDPFMYNGKTFCTGCQTYVDDSEVFWVETGQRMSEYRMALQRNARQGRR